MKPLLLTLLLSTLTQAQMAEKAGYLQQDLIEKHLLGGLYVSIVPAGTAVPHTVDDPGNVIHAGVWTGRYLAGVAYQYSVTQDPKVRQHGNDLLLGLRRLQEVTGKPGLLARGYVKGHGPVEGFERNGADSQHWHQGQGQFADYRFYSNVSVDNFNAVLYGYALYFDLAADAAQKKMISEDVDRLMTHLLDNHYRIIDLNGNVTQYGHVGVDPDPSRDEYYAKGGDSELKRYMTGAEWHPALRASLMALPNLLIAYHITGKPRYIDEYKKVVTRFAANPEPPRDTRPYSLERIAKVNHSSEGQAYEALFNLIRYEKDPKLLAIYEGWTRDLWDLNWMEGNALYTFMTVALIPKNLAHSDESLKLSIDTLRRYPTDRVMHPVMITDVEMSPFEDRGHAKQAAKPVPIDRRPLDNEYAWKGNPYAVEGWLKPDVTSIQFACDDVLVAWFSDSTGHAYMTRDGMKTWTDVSHGLMGAKVKLLAASKTRTFVVWADTNRGIAITRDGGMSWQPSEDHPVFERSDPEQVPTTGWRIPIAHWMFQTPKGAIAGGPGGAYLNGIELKLWPESETGAADFLHAYWMGRYYKFFNE